MTNDNQKSPIERISNENYLSDVNFAVQHTRWFLTLLGVWPYVIPNPTKIQMLVSKFALPIPTILISMLLTQIISFLIMRDLTQPQVIALLGPITFRGANVLKDMIIIGRRDAIKFCIQHMETDWRRIENENEREIMTRNLRVGRGLSSVCMSFMYGSGIFYQILMPLMNGNTVNALNQTVRPLPLPGADIFVDLQAGYNYEMVFIGQCLAAFFTYSIVITVCNLAAITVSHACGQIDIVMTRLENLARVDDKQTETLQERIAWIVRCHVRVLRFTTTMEELLRDMCLVEVVANTLVICFVEYWCMTGWKNKSAVALIPYAMLLCALCFNIFILCHLGERLKEREVGRATYMMDWYRLPSKAGRSLLMVIAMSHYPRKLTAGRMMDLSIFSFGSIMKTTVAYLNMLRAVGE